MVDDPTGIPCSTPYETFSHIHWSYFINSSLSPSHPYNKPTSEGACILTEPNPEAEADDDHLSPQQNEELDDTMASVHANLTQDDQKTKSPEKIKHDKNIPNVDTVQTEEKGQPTTIKENQAQPIVHDASSNTSLSQDHILAIKRKKLPKL